MKIQKQKHSSKSMHLTISAKYWLFDESLWPRCNAYDEIGIYFYKIYLYGIMHHGLSILYDCSYCKLRPSNHPLMQVKAFGHGPLVRYVKLWFVRAPGMLGTFSPPARFSDPDKHNGKYVTHVPWWMPGSLTRDFLFKSAARKTFPVDPAHA